MAATFSTRNAQELLGGFATYTNASELVDDDTADAPATSPTTAFLTYWTWSMGC